MRAERMREKERGFVLRYLAHKKQSPVGPYGGQWGGLFLVSEVALYDWDA